MNDFWDSQSALAALTWQLEAGVDESICDDPIDRFAAHVEEQAKKAEESKNAFGLNDKAKGKPPPKLPDRDPVAEAQRAAANAADLAGLRRAMQDFDLCDLKRGARQLVFADGDPAADVMILGEGPGLDCDREGKPFCGPAGRLLDKMLAAIDLDRNGSGANGVYLTTVVPWRLPRTGKPQPKDLACMVPFVQRHIQLVQPKVLVLMGNLACEAAVQRAGLTRLRGQFVQAFGLQALPMYAPEFLLKTPACKREAWADLLTLRAHLNQKGAS